MEVKHFSNSALLLAAARIANDLLGVVFRQLREGIAAARKPFILGKNAQRVSFSGPNTANSARPTFWVSGFVAVTKNASHLTLRGGNAISTP